MPELLEDLRILVVEDNIEAMRLLKMMLSDLRITDLHEAKDGHEAQTIFQGPSFYTGMAAGETDVEEWFKNNLNSPFGWSVYVHDNPGTS